MSNAATISRVLRKGGLNPLGSGTSRMREGIRVSNTHLASSPVLVSVDVDFEAKADRLVRDVVDILREAGYTTDVRTHLVYVEARS